MKRIISWVLSLVMILGMVPAVAFLAVESSAAESATYTYVQQKPVTLASSDTSAVGVWYNNGSTFVTTEGSANYIEIVADGYKDAGALHVYQDNVANNDMSIGAFLGGQAAGTYTLKFDVKGALGVYSDQTCKFYVPGFDGQISNLSTKLNTLSVADWTTVTYEGIEISSEFYYLIFSFSKYNWAADIYIDNVQLINASGVNVLGNAGNFCVLEEVTVNCEDTNQWPDASKLDTTTISGAYGGTLTNAWTPMYPTGAADEGTWAAWDNVHYAEISANGYKDAGSLHLVSCPGKNTGIAINAGMTAGETYTLGFYAKGTVNTGKVLGMYANGDGTIVADTASFGAGWNYYEHTFTADLSQINLVAADWGYVDIYLDNITLKNSAGVDLLSGCGDFYTEETKTYYTVMQEKAASIIPNDNSTVGAWYNNGSTFVTDAGNANYIEVVENGCKDAGALHVYQDNVANNDMSLGVFLGGQAAGNYTVKFNIKGDIGYQDQPFKFYPFGTESLVSNVSTILGTTEVADWTEVSYDVAVSSDFFYLIFYFSKYNWETNAYIDNIQLINSSGVDVLNGAGNFYTAKTVSMNSAVTGQYPVTLDTTKIGNSWGSAPGDEWVPFAPTGEFDPAYGFSAWTDTCYSEIVADGYKDAGSLHMVISQNTAVVINAGMVAGEQYTIGMWVKGTATSNRVLGLYGNGDPAIIGNPEYCGEVAASTVPADWTYLEKTFTANTNSVVLHGNGWGPADIYIDNVTLKNSSGLDLISGYGDFYILKNSTGEEEEDVSGTNIYGKSALFTGDSISWGSDQRAWAARIGEKYAMTYVNAAVSGASVSTTRVYRMIEQLEANKTGSFDYVIMHGPTNDAWDEVNVGTLSESYNVANYDVTTYAGALEELFYYARKYFPDAQLGYIINFRFSSTLNNGLSDMSAYVEMAKQVCNKWSVPYLDLYNNEELTAALKVGTTVYLPDNVHPNAAGYDILTPYIANWMNETVATQEPPVEPENPTEPAVEGLGVISDSLERAYRWYWNGVTYEETDHSKVEISAQGANDTGSLHIWQSSAAPSDTVLGLVTTMAHDLESDSYTLSMNVKGVFYNTEGFYVHPAYSGLSADQFAYLNVNNKLATAEGVSSVDGAYVTDGWINLQWTLPANPEDGENGFMFLTLQFSKYNVGEYYIDNIQVLDPNGNDVLGGAGSFMDSGSEYFPIILPSTGAEILNSNTMYYQVSAGESNVSVSNHVESGITCGDQNFTVTHNGVTQAASNKNVTMQMTPAREGEPIVFAITSTVSSLDIPSGVFEMMQRAGEFNIYDVKVTATSCSHSYSDWDVTAAPTYTVAGSQSKTCALCGDVVTEEIPVLANPVTSWNITLKDNIGVNFVMALADTDVVTATVGGNAVDCTVADGKLSINVAAAQMMDEIAISVNGLPLANTYSVRKYADTILADDSKSDCHELVKNMLVYGGAAQTYFGYNSDDANLASNGITVDAKIPTGEAATDISGSVSGIRFYGASLVLKNKIAVRFYFTGSIEGLTFSQGTPDQKGNMYYVEIADICPQDLDQDIVISVTNGNDTLTVTYSALDYIIRMYAQGGNSAPLVQALYGYYLAAEAYTA